MISPSLNPVNCWNTLKPPCQSGTGDGVRQELEKLADETMGYQQPSLSGMSGRFNDQRKYSRPEEISTSAGLFALMTPEFGDFGVRGPVHHLQVLRTVIRSDSVDMMDNLVGREIPTELRFHDKPMRHNVSFAIRKRMIGLSDHDIFVFKGVSRMELVRDENVLSSAKLTNIIGRKSDLGCDFGCRKTFQRKFSNLFYGGNPDLSPDAELSHPSKHGDFTHSKFTRDLQRRASLAVFPLQLLLGEGNQLPVGFDTKDLHVSKNGGVTHIMSAGDFMDGLIPSVLVIQRFFCERNDRGASNDKAVFSADTVNSVRIKSEFVSDFFSTQTGIRKFSHLFYRHRSTHERYGTRSRFWCQAKRRYSLDCVERHRRQDKEPADNSEFSDIKGMGSQVEIRTEGDVPVYLNEYQKGGVLKPPDRIESPAMTLYIDQCTHFYFGIDSIDKYQSDINLMSQWADNATKNEKVKIDTDVLAYFCGQSPYSTALPDSNNYGSNAGVISGLYDLGTVGAPYEVTTSNIIKLLAMCEAVLGEQNVPDDDEWFFVMPRVMAMLLKTSDIKDASMMGDATSTLRSGRLGRLLNFTLYASNLLPKGPGTAGVDTTTGKLCFYCLFGHKYGLTFASQFTETNYIDNPETTFGRFIKSLHVFGRKVIKPSAIGMVYAQPTLS